MEIKRKKEIKDNLTIQLNTYLKAIINNYSPFMGEHNLNRLKNMNLDDVIQISDFDSVNAYANQANIYMPLGADEILTKVSKLPGCGLYKNHQSYKEDTLIINNNNFIDYLKHVYLTGCNTETYYQELLLHETMHFCGSGGATALKEGINEYLTRKIALEYNFITNGCGYPKEIEVVVCLEKLFGIETINSIAFINDEYYILQFLELKHGKEAARLYKVLHDTMQIEFETKYYSKFDEYNGIKGILKKVSNYAEIDYSVVYELINEYTKTSMNNKKIL